MAHQRAHTGRQRNEAARQAILDAALRLFGTSGGDVTVGAIAAEAGVGKQTIYRWWPSKYAILLEAFTAYGSAVVPQPDTGTVDGDLRAFVVATFDGMTEAAPVLSALMGEAQRDPATLETLREFTDRRRTALRALLERGRARAELPPGADFDLLIDQVYGVLWYRVLLGHGPLSPRAAAELATGLLRQIRRD
ncbi:TetR/AcrR family transcriptional regulator [Phytomonospora endophytica]|uniref:AcrR family transcriptional regulator n=1 Tax=Phytomonospora endophytica TaxID=714109 RepID=A0A841G519_9ACTN|nr:TetR/AcrR family transcriptional regulator [Phytomonospora endophytica]MBB6039200.1 AcrR family transcriptional regulator [Phytomonospora endophytica]GIG67563.1 TetR family transcriptional regulator [Phytomonospora endophytica]